MNNEKGIIDFPTLTTAPLQNVSSFYRGLLRAMERKPHLPGMVVFYGPSGFGKSTAASYAANKTKAFYIECRSTWTRKAILIAIAKSMGIDSSGPLYDLTDRVSEHLCLTKQPLIIDEMDHLVEKKCVEVIRDIYEGSQGTIMMIGEGGMPAKLKRWERFHGRVLEWIEASPLNMDDLNLLNRLYCRKVTIENDLIALVYKVSRGSARRACVNLDLIQEEAPKHGWRQVDAARWGDRELYTGEPRGHQ